MRVQRHVFADIRWTNHVAVQIRTKRKMIQLIGERPRLFPNAQAEIAGRRRPRRVQNLCSVRVPLRKAHIDDSTVRDEGRALGNELHMPEANNRSTDWRHLLALAALCARGRRRCLQRSRAQQKSGCSIGCHRSVRRSALRPRIHC